MEEKSKAEQYLTERNFGGEYHWFDSNIDIYYDIRPSVMQDYANKEINDLLTNLKNNVKMMDDLDKAKVKSLIDQFRRP